MRLADRLPKEYRRSDLNGVFQELSGMVEMVFGIQQSVAGY